jgi:hypothetical protein
MRFLKQKTLSQYSASDNALMVYDNRPSNSTNHGARAVMDIAGALRLPKGTTDQRPKMSNVRTPNGPNGYIRYNTTTNSIEGYIDSAWEVIRAPGASAIQVSRLPANGTETTFGPLNSAYVSSYSVSDYNLMVLVDNVIQIGARVNYKLVQYNGSIFVTAGSSGAVYSTTGPGTYNSGDYYIQFPTAVPAFGGTGDPIYVTVFYGYGN